MKDLDLTREKIDTIDKEIIRLFEERMTLVKDVIEYKIENNMEILDSGREEFILEKNRKLLNNKEYADYLDEFFKSIMKISRKMQNKILEDNKDE